MSSTDILKEPAVTYHIYFFIGVCVVTLVACGLRCWLLCRPHSDVVTYAARESGASWWQWAAKRAIKFLWASQTMLLLLISAALITVAVLVSDLELLFEAIKDVVNYPNLVLDDLYNFNPGGEVCGPLLTEARGYAISYEVPDFKEIDSFVNLLWIAIGLWASMVGFYVAADRIEVGVIACVKRATGTEPCASFGTRARRLCCISGISGCFMWLCTFAFVGAILAARTAIVVGCDYIDVPTEARYLFYTDSTEEHPFLESVREGLLACGAPPSVVRHIEPGALSPQLAALYNVCDNLEDQLMALAVLGTFIFPTTVVAAWLRQSDQAGVTAFEFLL